MSQVTLEGNASGTGIFTVAAPNSNTNRTLTLPDATGTVVTTDATQTLTNKSISGGQINSGTVAVARLGSGSPSASNFLRGDGSWQAVSGGVTSLNGQSGAITNTAVDSIGNTVIGGVPGYGLDGAQFTVGGTYTGVQVLRFIPYTWSGPTSVAGTWRMVGQTGSFQQATGSNEHIALFVRIS